MRENAEQRARQCRLHFASLADLPRAPCYTVEPYIFVGGRLLRACACLAHDEAVIAIQMRGELLRGGDTLIQLDPRVGEHRWRARSAA